MGPIRVKTRVRELRKARGWTLETLSEKSGVSTSQISNIERGQKGWSVDSLFAIATALDTTVDKLFDMAGAWQEVPIFGVIKGDGGAVSKCERGKAKKRAKVPAAFGELLAIRVLGSGLYPRYNDGDLIFCAKQSQEADACVGRECLVTLEHGEQLLRFVSEGTKPKHYNLTIHNHPAMFDEQILFCHPVVHAGPQLP